VTTQEEHLGAGSIAVLRDLIAGFAPRCIMLVAGRQSYHLSGASDAVEPALAGARTVRFFDFSTNPKIADIERGVALWRAARPDLVVAVGGGSALDVAKLINLLGPSAASWRSLLDGGDPPTTTVGPLIAVPTTAGSGAEATHFAAFYADDVKRSLAHPLLRPSHSIVDPTLTASMAPPLAAATGLDALAQAIESFWAVGATVESQDLAEAALREILPSVRDAVHAPTPLSRERMARGAHLTGRAIDVSKTTAAHALSYPLTTEFGLAHGHAVALVLPAVLRLNAEPANRQINEPRGAGYLVSTMERLLRLLGGSDAAAAARALENLVGELGLAAFIPHARRSASAEAERLARMIDPERLANNPVRISQADAAAIYAGLLQGQATGAVA
jgi:alcohol dehydrogenase class IV